MSPRNGLEVIGAMRRVYPSRQLVSLAYTVTTTDHRSTGRRSSRERVRARLPITSTARRPDLATIVAYDVFAQSIDTTIMWLDSTNIRYGLARRDEFEGRAVWVVGAEAGDMRSAQFWVDADLWRVVRVIQRDPRDGDDVLDVRFTAFSQQLGVPVPTRSVVYRNGSLAQTRVMSALRVN